jgi:hypothetical protein
MKEISYQVERQSPGSGWEQMSPKVAEAHEATTLVLARRIEAKYSGDKAVFRVVKTERVPVAK